jgi:antitoxin ParD1/3/4
MRDYSMAGAGKLSVTLAPEAMAVVNEAVASGEYATASEVVADALLNWRANREQPGFGTEELRKLWSEGVVSGPGRFASIEEIKAEVRRRAAKEKST